MHFANASIWSAIAGSIVALGSPTIPDGRRLRHALSASCIALGSSSFGPLWGSPFAVCCVVTGPLPTVPPLP